MRISTPSAAAARFASASGLTLKPITIASDAAASITSDSLIPPAAAWTTSTATSSWGSFAISSWSASSEPETSALTQQVDLLDLALLGLREDVLERDPAGIAASLSLGLEPDRPLAGELAGAAVVLDDLGALAGLADAVEAEHLDRLARAAPT